MYHNCVSNILQHIKTVNEIWWNKKLFFNFCFWVKLNLKSDTYFCYFSLLVFFFFRSLHFSMFFFFLLSFFSSKFFALHPTTKKTIILINTTQLWRYEINTILCLWIVALYVNLLHQILNISEFLTECATFLKTPCYLNSR